VPVGTPCAWCEERFRLDDSGLGIDGDAPLFYHVECFTRMIVGSVGHQLRLCTCFGGSDDCEPSTMTRHEWAHAAAELAAERRTIPARHLVRLATDDEQRAAIVAVARRKVAEGAGHDCTEWPDLVGACELCGRKL